MGCSTCRDPKSDGSVDCLVDEEPKDLFAAEANGGGAFGGAALHLNAGFFGSVVESVDLRLRCWSRRAAVGLVLGEIRHTRHDERVIRGERERKVVW